MEEVLHSLIQAAPFIKELFDAGTAITVEDNKEFLYISCDKGLEMPYKVGDKIEENVSRSAIRRDKKTVRFSLSKEVQGIDRKIITVPILNSGDEVIGSFSLVRNTEREGIVQNISIEIRKALEAIGNTIEGIAKDASRLSENIIFLIEKTDVTMEGIKESGKFIELIENLSKQTNMLGINTAIEAARAGEQGKGFSVIAQEMRKLSSLSEESSKSITDELSEMECNMKSITDSFNSLGEISTNLAAAIEEVAGTIQVIASNSEELVNQVNVN